MIALLIISAAAGAALYQRHKARRDRQQHEVLAQQERQRVATSCNIRLTVYTALLEQFPNCRHLQAARDEAEGGKPINGR